MCVENIKHSLKHLLKPLILADIENSIGLAIDTVIQDVVILGDFNLNFLNTQIKSKINNICRQFNLTQLITEPTNFAETSFTIIDLILVSNLRTVELSGVGEPFLMQDIQYHCPTYCVTKDQAAFTIYPPPPSPAPPPQKKICNISGIPPKYLKF